MADIIWQIVQWLVPAGGLGAVLLWFTNKTIRLTRTNKEVHDTYKQMYDDMNDTLIDLQNENKKLYRAVSKLERTITKATTCVHYSACPMRTELQEQSKNNDYMPKRRQHGAREKNDNVARASPSEPDFTGDPC